MRSRPDRFFAIEQGAFEAGTYTAPGELFTVKSPLGPSPILVDSFDELTGAVTFLDETGELYGLICTPNFDVLAGADNDFETDAAILRNWFHDATFPLFFARQLPGATIIHEEPGTFDGSPAWFAVMHLPRGSAMFRNDAETGLPTRLDSIRGVVVFSRGRTDLPDHDRDRARARMESLPAEARGFLPGYFLQ